MTALNSAVPVEPGSADGFLRPTAIVLAGDCRVLMADMDADSVDSVVADAPYELGFMGSSWDSTGVAYDVDTWRAAYHVIKPGGFLLCFGGSRTYHRMACAIEDAGFEIRDQIMWIYGSGFPKGGNREGKGTCLKPAHEPIVMARKPFKGSVTANEARNGTGALNIDACRVPTGEALRAGACIIPMRHDPAAPRGRDGQASAANRYQAKGGTDFAATPGPRGGDEKGRWPANVIHDGSDEVVKGFPESESRGGLTKRTVSCGFSGGGRGADTPNYGNDSGTAARYFYCAKASKADRDEGLDAFDPQAFVQFQTGNGESGNPSSLSDGRETQYRNTHPTVKPTALMRYLVRLVTPVGGTVLDPFTGSGSTGKAAVLEGRSFIGCELTEAYVPIARARIAAALNKAYPTPAPAPLADMVIPMSAAQSDLFGEAA
jgi:DNA modification methylase